MKSYRHQAVVPVAVCYAIILICLSLVGPLRIAKAFLRDVIEGSGKVVRESRNVKDFDAIEVAGVGELSATPGNQESLTVEAEDNIAPVIITETKNNCLYIQVKPKTNLRPTKPIRYTLTYKDLNRVGLAGAIKAEIGNLKAENLKIDASGVCKANFAEIQADKVSIHASGACNIRASGKADDEKVDVSGVSMYDGANVVSKSANVAASGASKVVVNASDTLKTSASGVSSVRYKGSPKVTRGTSGNASVGNESVVNDN